MTKEREEQLKRDLWTPYHIQKRQWVCKPHRPDRAEDKLDRITQWVDAYPIDIFPEPDFKKAAKLLQAGGMTLGGIFASNMRGVLRGLKEIIEGKRG